MKARISVKVHPGAKRTALVGKLGDSYKLDIASPPSDGKANQACTEFLAATLRVPKAAVRIVSGATSRTKIIEIDGMDSETVRNRLGK